MKNTKILEILGKGSLIVTATIPIWFEISTWLSYERDNYSPPIILNVVYIVIFFSIPCIICLLLSRNLYRYTNTKAPVISCVISLVMFACTILLILGGYNSVHGLIAIPLLVVQNLIGIALFGALKYYYRKSN